MRYIRSRMNDWAIDIHYLWVYIKSVLKMIYGGPSETGTYQYSSYIDHGIFLHGCCSWNILSNQMDGE